MNEIEKKENREKRIALAMLMIAFNLAYKVTNIDYAETIFARARSEPTDYPEFLMMFNVLISLLLIYLACPTIDTEVERRRLESESTPHNHRNTT